LILPDCKLFKMEVVLRHKNASFAGIDLQQI